VTNPGNTGLKTNFHLFKPIEIIKSEKAEILHPHHLRISLSIENHKDQHHNSLKKEIKKRHPKAPFNSLD